MLDFFSRRAGVPINQDWGSWCLQVKIENCQILVFCAKWALFSNPLTYGLIECHLLFHDPKVHCQFSTSEECSAHNVLLTLPTSWLHHINGTRVLEGGVCNCMHCINFCYMVAPSTHLTLTQKLDVSSAVPWDSSWQQQCVLFLVNHEFSWWVVECMLRLPVGVAMYSWGQTILLETSHQVLQLLDPHTMEHSGFPESVSLLTFIFLVMSCHRNESTVVHNPRRTCMFIHVCMVWVYAWCSRGPSQNTQRDFLQFVWGGNV